MCVCVCVCMYIPLTSFKIIPAFEWRKRERPRKRTDAVVSSYSWHAYACNGDQEVNLPADFEDTTKDLRDISK